MPRDWQAEITNLTNVQRLVHLAVRQDSVNVEQIRAELVKVRRRAYEQELSIQAARVGCAGRAGQLTVGPALTALNEQSKEDAKGIVNTYNAELVTAIQDIAAQLPSANRNVYVKRLEEWETKRNVWKSEQIARYSEGTARSMAQADFYRMNKLSGVAILEPGTAKEPICAGWINRGEVPLKEALKNPMPIHVNCVHLWTINPERVPKAECETLWVGE